MEHLEAYNRKLLANILPVHVAEHFLNSDKNNDVSYKTINELFVLKVDSTGTLPRTMRFCLHYVCFDPQFLRILCRIRRQQRRRGMSTTLK